MLFTQYYLQCLSQASYLIGDPGAGVGAVVDPRRDVQQYLDDAEKAGVRIGYVIETHFHADFLSGHLELAAATGAEVVYGAAADAQFPHRKVRDGERIALGEVILEFRATPGHTPESISVVVWEHPDDPEPYGVLTGDTLFIGDVGRPDLLASSGVTADDLARQLHHSLQTKLLTLPDATRVYPAHGAGSACGKNLSAATVSTIGEQRHMNYALQPMTVDEFVVAVSGGQDNAPGYFPYAARLNRKTRALLDANRPPSLTLDGLLAAQGKGALVLDTRSPQAFARAHLRRSINIGLDGRFAEYAGSLIESERDIALVTEPGMATEAKIRLGRIGYDRVAGALEDIEAALVETPQHAMRAPRLTAVQLAEEMAEIEDLVVIDVRNPGERAMGAIEGSLHLPLSVLARRAGELDLRRPIAVYCAGGYRSSMAASFLRAAGGVGIADLIGGYEAWRAARRSAVA